MAAPSTTRERALQLLGTGTCSAEQVAAACGVTASAISQLLSDEVFAGEVAALRYRNLSSNTERDSRYDDMEDKLLEKLHHSIPLMVRPMEVLKAIQVINGAKRRGAAGDIAAIQQTNIVNLTLPTAIVNKFTTNMQNQVVSAGAQELLTIQSGTLLKQSKELKGITYDHQQEGIAGTLPNNSGS